MEKRVAALGNQCIGVARAMFKGEVDPGDVPAAGSWKKWKACRPMGREVSERIRSATPKAMAAGIFELVFTLTNPVVNCSSLPMRIVCAS